MMARRTWTLTDPLWRSLSDTEKAAAMALLEAPGADARNVLGAMLNRAELDGEGLGDSVGSEIYQPSFEPGQQRRLPDVLRDPSFGALVKDAEARLSGSTPDWVKGATHFLAPEQTMLDLEARDPAKYRSWRDWTGFDDAAGEYSGVLMRDGSHAFLAPDERKPAKLDPLGREAMAPVAPPVAEKLIPDGSGGKTLAPTGDIAPGSIDLTHGVAPLLASLGGIGRDDITGALGDVPGSILADLFGFGNQGGEKTAEGNGQAGAKAPESGLGLSLFGVPIGGPTEAVKRNFAALNSGGAPNITAPAILSPSNGRQIDLTRLASILRHRKGLGA